MLSEKIFEIIAFFRNLNKKKTKKTRKNEKKKNKNRNRKKTHSREGNSTFIDKSELITIESLDRTDNVEIEGKKKSYPD